jgi:prepilin-type N-terminal cleavage/methylation domain-containing protein
MRRRGFTLVELLVVISIIAVLASLSLVAISAALERGRVTKCMNHITEQGKAMFAFQASKNYFPGYRNPSPHKPATGTANPVSWQVSILRYVGRDSDADQWSGGTRMTAYYELYVCPSDATAMGLAGPMTSYAVNAGKSGNNDTTSRFEGISHDLTLSTANKLKVSATDIPDGADRTVLIVENLDADKYEYNNTSDLESVWGIVWGGANYNINMPATGANRRTSFNGGDFTFARPSSSHGGSAMVIFAGTNAKEISQDIDPNVWNLLMTPNGTKCNPAQTGTLQDGSF